MNIESIWEQYRLAIKRFLSSRIVNSADVDDLLQNIAIKTYEKLHTIKSEDKIKPWLFQVANRTIIDFYREKSRRHKLTADELWYAENDDEIKDALAECIQPFIKALPSEYSQLLQAIDIEGQSQKHYAKKHGIHYSTLKSRMQKSRLLLKSLFESCCNLTLDHQGRLSDCDSKHATCQQCKPNSR